MADEDEFEGTSPHPLYQKCLKALERRCTRLIKQYPLAVNRPIRVEMREKPEGTDGNLTIKLLLDEVEIDNDSSFKFYPWYLAYILENWDLVEGEIQKVHLDTERRMTDWLKPKRSRKKAVQKAPKEQSVTKTSKTAWDRLGES